MSGAGSVGGDGSGREAALGAAGAVVGGLRLGLLGGSGIPYLESIRNPRPLSLRMWRHAWKSGNYKVYRASSCRKSGCVSACTIVGLDQMAWKSGTFRRGGRPIMAG